MQRKKLRLLDPETLGDGKDGFVWSTSAPSAIKVHVAAPSYQTELAAYIRLRERQIDEIAGFEIPRLIDYDDELLALALEMSIVFPPFLVDFASAVLDAPPDFLEDEGHTFEDFIRDRFDERADEVLDLYYQLASHTGIYLSDMHRDNVKFSA